MAELRRRVQAFRDWRPSIVEPRVSSCTVRSGAYTYPLTVECYYVTALDEQQALVQLVTDFLAGIDKNEALVHFVEAENWTVSEDGAGSRGPETTLYLNCGPHIS